MGKHSNVIEGTTGVAVVFVNNANEYNANNIDMLKEQIKQESEQNTQGGIEAALIEKADVKDQRYKFYN